MGFDPATMAVMSMVASGVGTAVSAMGQMQAGKAASAAASYNAQVAENNRKIAEQNAEYATRAGMARAEQESLQGRAAMGKIRAAQASSGVTVGSDSFADVEEGAREANVLDVANVIQKAQLEAYGYRSQAAGFEAEAGLSKMRADSAESEGTVGALGTLLSGAGALGSKWSAMNDKKPDAGGGGGGKASLGMGDYLIAGGF
jgi:hypothetical protein